MVPQVNIVSSAKYKVPKLFIQKASVLFFQYLEEVGVINSCNTYSLTIVFVSKDEITDYNRKYRNKSVPTDVLSFCATSEEDALTRNKKSMVNKLELGDILICADVVKDNAIRFDTVYDKELVRMTVHGILHLLGFDHKGKLGEMDEEMFSIQESFMVKFNESCFIE